MNRIETIGKGRKGSPIRYSLSGQEYYEFGKQLDGIHSAQPIEERFGTKEYASESIDDLCGPDGSEIDSSQPLKSRVGPKEGAGEVGVAGAAGIAHGGMPEEKYAG